MPNEINSFAFALDWLVAEKDFQTPAVPVDFFYAKGNLGSPLTRLGLGDLCKHRKSRVSTQDVQPALIGDQVIGVLGQVHPVTAKAYDIPETYVAELNLSAIEAALQPAAAFVEITKFPAVSRDIALSPQSRSDPPRSG